MTILAECRAVTPSRPPARRLVEPLTVHTEQPTLPWDGPAVIDEPDELDPALRQLATAVVAAIVEALAGRRAAAQLETWVEPEPLALLEHLRRAGAGSGLRLRSLRLQQPSRHALEVAAHLRHAGASRAAAFRFSRVNDRWAVCRIELSLRPDVISRAGWPRR
ncbi:MAG: Rv3235 family protein [Propionicimonas sp.]